MREADFAPASFDAVTAIYSLLYVPSGEHPALFAHLHRWLRPGGRLLFNDATRADTGAARFEGYLDFMGQRLFDSHATPDALAIQLAEAGLEVLDWRERDIGGESFLCVTAGVAEPGAPDSRS